MDSEFNLNLTVRLKTTRYMTSKKLVECRELSLLRRKSNAELSDLILDPCVDIESIELHGYSDGVYTIGTCNHGFDVESGHLDEYDLCLVEIEGEDYGH